MVGGAKGCAWWLRIGRALVDGKLEEDDGREEKAVWDLC